METIAVFSLGSTVLEFARFGIELLRNGAELYKSSQGALSTNQQLELATADLRALLVKLRTRPHLLTTTEDDFSRLLQLAENTAGELVERLERLKVKDTKSRKWKSVYKAIEHVWTQEEISMLTKKLAKLKQDVNTHVLHYILYVTSYLLPQRNHSELIRAGRLWIKNHFGIPPDTVVSTKGHNLLSYPSSRVVPTRKKQTQLSKIFGTTWRRSCILYVGLIMSIRMNTVELEEKLQKKILAMSGPKPA
jgi:hypothetical protein